MAKRANVFSDIEISPRLQCRDSITRCGYLCWMGSPLEDPAAADDFVVLIKDGGLAGCDRALGLVEDGEDISFERWAVNFCGGLACS